MLCTLAVTSLAVGLMSSHRRVNIIAIVICGVFSDPVQVFGNVSLTTQLSQEGSIDVRLGHEQLSLGLVLEALSGRGNHLGQLRRSGRSLKVDGFFVE